MKTRMLRKEYRGHRGEEYMYTDKSVLKNLSGENGIHITSDMQEAIRVYDRNEEREKKRRRNHICFEDARYIPQSSFVETTCEKRLLQESLLKMIPVAYRELFHLRFVEGKSIRDISREKCMKEESIRKKIYRIRRRINDEYEKKRNKGL